LWAFLQAFSHSLGCASCPPLAEENTNALAIVIERTKKKRKLSFLFKCLPSLVGLTCL